jgi:hypothetical protein
MILHGELNEEKVVDNRKREYRGIQKRDEQQAGRSQAACKGYDLLLPSVET